MGCWRLQGGSRICVYECVCVFECVLKARRAAGELENFTAFSDGDL